VTAQTEGQAVAALAPPRSGLAAALGPLSARLARMSGLQSASAGAFAVLVTGAGISYLTQVATARLLGAESFGVYAYVLAWVTVLAYLSTLGFHVSLLRLVSTYRAQVDWPRARGVIRFARLGAATTGTLLALGGAAAILVVGGLEPELSTSFLIGLAAAPLLALQFVGAATVRVFGSVISALTPERLVRDGLALALLAALIFSGACRTGAPAAMLALFGSAAGTLWLVTRLARRARPPELQRARPRFAMRNWVRPTLPLSVIMAADVTMSRCGVIVLGLVGDTAVAGVFAAAFALATLVALPRMAVAAAFAPTVADLHARGDRAGLQALAVRAARLSLSGAACVAAPLMLAAPELLTLFGKDFAAGAPAVAILIFGQLVAAAAGPQQHMITMTGREAAGAAMQAGGALFSVALCFALARPLGVVGAAAASSAGVIAWNVAMAVFVLRCLGLRPGPIATAGRSPSDRRTGATP
jgi:O-antigen/teichoic acid export membrane protein